MLHVVLNLVVLGFWGGGVCACVCVVVELISEGVVYFQAFFWDAEGAGGSKGHFSSGWFYLPVVF